MKCMRVVNLLISFSLLVSVEAFAGYGNFGTIVKTAQDAYIAAEVDEDPNYKQPAVWNSDCDNSGNIHKANLIPKNGNPDPRRNLNQQEQADASGVGFFHGADKVGKFVGSGFAVENRKVLLTAAHNFVDKGVWRDYVKNADGTLNVKGAQFYSDVCGRSYSIKSVEVLTENPSLDRDNDVGIVVLEEPLCAKAMPLPTQPLNESKLLKLFSASEKSKQSYISVVGFQWAERYEDKRSDTQTSAGEPNNKKKKISKLIDDGVLIKDSEPELKKTVLMNASLLPGTSGGPVYGKFKGGRANPNTGSAIAIVISELNDGTLNRARIIDEELDAKIQRIVGQNP